METPPKLEVVDRGVGVGSDKAGNLVGFGNIEPGSASYCHGWAYWRDSRDNNPGSADDLSRTSEIRRWQPGSNVEVVYRTQDLPTTINCNDAGFSVTVHSSTFTVYQFNMTDR